MNLNIIAIGHAAGLLQKMPDRIRQAAAAIGVQPAARINGVDHFDAADLDRIAAHLRAASADASAMASRVTGLC